MPPSQKVVVVLEVRASRKIDAELTKAKSKVKGWAATLSKEMKNVFKRATFFRFSTIGINSFFNSIRFARQEALAFQDALGNIVKVDLNRFMSLNSAATKRLSEDLSIAANRYGILRVEAAKTLEAITVAGIRGADAMKVLDTALLGQAATGLKAAEVFRAILLPAMLQFKVGIGDLESALDVLVTTQANAAVGFGDFAGAFRAGGATLAGTTRSLNEAAALVAALGEVTQESGATVGTFFKTLAPRLLANPGARRILEEQKVAIADPQTGALRSSLAILLDLNRSMEGMGAVAKRTRLSVVSGIRQGNRLIAVLNALNKVEELVAKNSQSAGDTRRRVAVEQQKLSVKWRKVQNQFAASLEKAVLPVMDDMIFAARDVALLGTRAAVTLMEVAQALGIISKADAREGRQLEEVAALRQAVKGLSKAGLKEVNKDIAKMGFQFSQFNMDEMRREMQDVIADPGFIITGAAKGITNILGADLESSKRAFASINDILTTYDAAIATGTEFGKDTLQKINFLKAVLGKVEDTVKRDRKLGRAAQRTTLSTGLQAKEQQGSLFRDVLDKFNKDLREGAPAAAIQQLNVQLTNALEAIIKPAKSFNRGLLQQRKALVEVNQARKQSRDDVLAAVEAQAQADIKGLDAQAAKSLQTDLQAAKDKVRAAELKDQVKLAEFDAKAMRRLNTELNSMKDKTKDATSKLSTSTKRLNELRIEEAKSATAVAQATISLKNALVEYEVGLIRARLESKQITGEVGGLAQQLAGAKRIIPIFLNSLTQELLKPSRIPGGFGGDNIIKDEIKIASLRRESLREQLDLTKQIINRQREIGASFFGLDAGGRSELVQGLGAIQKLFGRFGGDVSKFRGLSTKDLNAFGRQLLSLPDEVKNSILKATEFVPEGAAIAGFTGKQIRDLIATASLGRAAGTGILDIGALQEEAADSTLKLAAIQTDSLATSMDQLQVAQQQLDQQKAQTEVARIQVEVARQQLSVLASTQGARRAGVQAEMETIRRANRPTGPEMGTSAIIGHATLARIQAFSDMMSNVTAQFRESVESGRGQKEMLDSVTERFARFRDGITGVGENLVQLNGFLIGLNETLASYTQLPQGITTGAMQDSINQAKRQRAGVGIPESSIQEEIRKVMEKLIEGGGAGAGAGATTALEEINENTRRQNDIAVASQGVIEKVLLDIDDQLQQAVGPSAIKDVQIKISGETIDKLEVTGLAELPQVMADIVTNHPDVKDSKSLRANMGIIVRAMVEAGIEAGVFPPSLRAQVGLLNQTQSE